MAAAYAAYRDARTRLEQLESGPRSARQNSASCSSSSIASWRTPPCRAAKRRRCAASARCFATPSGCNRSAARASRCSTPGRARPSPALGRLARPAQRARRHRTRRSPPPPSWSTAAACSSRRRHCNCAPRPTGSKRDPDRLEAVESRLQLLSRLSRKHGMPSDELPERLAALARDLAAIESQSGDLASARAEVESSEHTASALARELSTARAAAARTLDKRMVGELSALGMRGAAFRTAHEAPSADAAVAALGPTGSTASSSSSPPIPARRRSRWPASRQAASCRASCWRSRRSPPRSARRRS